MFFPSRIRAQESIRDKIFTHYDYDNAIEEFESGKASDAQNTLYAAFAYYRKGKLALSAYRSGLELSEIYYNCRQDSKIPELSQSGFLQMATGMTKTARGDYEAALSHLQLYQQKIHDKYWNNISLIWQGCILDKLGRSSEGKKLWKSVDWANPLYSSERSMVQWLLNMPASPSNLELNRVQTTYEPYFIRNIILISGSLKGFSRIEKRALYKKLAINTTMSTGTVKKEEFYDILSVLAAGHCALAISLDLFEDGYKRLANDEKNKFPTVPFLMGHAAYLLEDYDQTIRLLESDGDPRSPVILGAAYFKKKDLSKAEKFWAKVEQGTDLKAQSWLGYTYALLGIKPDKAEDFTKKSLDNNSTEQGISQEDFGRYAAVLEMKAERQRADAKRDSCFNLARLIFNRGYDYSKQDIIGNDANDPEYTVLYCAAIERVNGLGMWEVNRMLSFARQYDVIIPLHEIAKNINICRDIRFRK